MYVVNENLMNRIVMVVGQNQNALSKLNAGQIREVVKLVINALCAEILGAEHNPLTEDSKMPAKKKSVAKKAKPMPKPLPKKGK